MGARRVGARRVGGLKFRSFFHSPATKFVPFFPLWGSSRGILVVFEAPGRSNVHVWSLGLSCEAPAAPKPPGFHTTAREPKRAHLSATALQNTTKIQREDPREGRKERILRREREKRAKFWAVQGKGGSGSTETKPKP